MTEEINLGGKRAPLKRLGTVQTINAETGEVISEQKNAFVMMPTKAGTCNECGVDHPHDQPHNRDSLTYQMRFHSTHGRYPTWTDAFQHCSDADKPLIRKALIYVHERNGLPIPDDLLDQKPSGR